VSSEFFFNKFSLCVGFWKKSMIIANISLTLRFNCFEVLFLLCKIMNVKGVF
jgi:hypothetical protein